MIKILKKIFKDEQTVEKGELPLINESEYSLEKVKEEKRLKELEAEKNSKPEPIVSAIFGIDESVDPLKAFYTKVDENYKKRNESLRQSADPEDKYKGFVMGNKDYYLNQLPEDERHRNREVRKKELISLDKELKIEDDFPNVDISDFSSDNNLDLIEPPVDNYDYDDDIFAGLDVPKDIEIPEEVNGLLVDDNDLEDDFVKTEDLSSVSEKTSSEEKMIDDFKKPTKRIKKEFVLPPYSLLDTPKPKDNSDLSYLKDQELVINSTLDQFQIPGRVVNFTNGPSVTQFEVSLDPGVKVNRLTGIEDNLKMNLASVNIRLEAPIPGKSTIGIEVPTKLRRTVEFASILTKDFIKNSKPLEVALGLDIGGELVSGDIAKMPHGLIAGSTGSGKSVCLDTILMSLVMKNTPSDLKMMLIDPKVVGLANYKEIPHLVTPIITDTSLSKEAINWVVEEMERRYLMLYNINAKDIDSYNRKIKERAEYSSLEKMPYFVLVIEEMADLMNVCGSEIEDYIMRLAQKSRACGIHMLIATQRPSVDVIKGSVKANIPTRIAMKVSSMSDSMTILDQVGADKLLGNGDMLFNFNGLGAKRCQGAYVKDEEIERVCDYLRQYDTNYLFTIDSLVEKKELSSKEEDLDPYFYEVAKFIIDNNYASINGVQKQFGIGFNRASAIFDQLEDEQIISRKNSKNPRKVIISLEEFITKYEK